MNLRTMLDWCGYVYEGPFLNGFWVAFTPPVVLILLTLILLNRVGGGLGLAKLFRHNDGPWIARVFIGMGVASVFFQALLAGYVFEEFATNFSKDRPPWIERPFGEAHKADTVREFAFYALAVMVCLLITGLAVWALLSALDWVGRWWSLRHYRESGVTGTAAAAGAVAAAGGAAASVIAAAGTVKDRQLPSSEETVVTSGPFWVGFAAGLAAMTAFAWFFFHDDSLRPVASRVGVAALDYAGYGQAAARKRWNAVKQEGLTPQEVRKLDRDGAMPGLFKDPDTYARGRDEYLAGGVRPDQVGLLDETAARRHFQTTARVADHAPYYAVYGVFLLNVALVAAVYVFNFLVWFVWRPLFSPAVGIIVLLHVVIAQDVIVTQFTRYPALVKAVFVLAVIFLGGLKLYKMQFPGLDYRRPKLLEDYCREVSAEVEPPPLPAGGETSAAISAAAAVAGQAAAAHARVSEQPPAVLWPQLRGGADLRPWRPEGVRKAPLAILCASGGGSRAAAWTTAVMARLEGEFARAGVALPYHTRIVAGASGGMVGMAGYTTRLAAPEAGAVAHVPGWPELPDPLTGEALEGWLRATGVADDWLTPVCHRLLYFDIPSIALPVAPRRDRGRALEAEWRRSFGDAAWSSFADLRGEEEEGWRPSLVFSPMLIEDGRQLLISNLDLRWALRNLGSELADRSRILSRPALEFFRLFPHADQFRVATAARMSATFPYLLPAVPLPTLPPRRVVDAGYYDNYGVQVAGAWLDTYRGWVRQNFSGVLFVQIRDSLSGDARRQERVFPAETPSLAWRSLQWLSSPFAGMFSARTASNSFRNDNMLNLLDQMYNAGDKNFFRVASFEFEHDDHVSLSFRLTGDELTAISQAAVGLKGIDKAVEWWKGRVEG